MRVDLAQLWSHKTLRQTTKLPAINLDLPSILAISRQRVGQIQFSLAQKGIAQDLGLQMLSLHSQEASPNRMMGPSALCHSQGRPGRKRHRNHRKGPVLRFLVPLRVSLHLTRHILQDQRHLPMKAANFQDREFLRDPIVRAPVRQPFSRDRALRRMTPIAVTVRDLARLRRSGHIVRADEPDLLRHLGFQDHSLQRREAIHQGQLPLHNQGSFIPTDHL